MEEIPQLIQYGGVGIGFFALWILYRVLTNHEKHFIEMTKQNTEFTKESTKAIMENTKVLTELKEVILRLQK